MSNGVDLASNYPLSSWRNNSCPICVCVCVCVWGGVWCVCVVCVWGVVCVGCGVCVWCVCGVWCVAKVISESEVKSLSHVRLLATPWTAAYQTPRPWDFRGRSTGVGCHCLLRLLHTVLLNCQLEQAVPIFFTLADFLSDYPSHCWWKGY